MQKYCTPEFTFNKVITYSPHWLTVVSIVAGGPLIGLYGIYGYPYLGMAGMSFIILFIFCLMKGIMHVSFKRVIIHFDRKRMYIKNNESDFKEFLKRDVVGIYSHNYDERQRAYVSITIVFKNGTRLSLNDTSFGDKTGDEKSQMLKRFLSTVKRHLNFTLINKSRWRAFQFLGPYWYSREPSVETLFKGSHEE